MADFARGQELVRLREARHLSQEDAAHEIGTSAKSLRAWEHGGPIRWVNAKRVAAFYGVEAEALVSRELKDPGPVLSEDAEERLKRIERDVQEILKRLPAAPPQEPPAVKPPPSEPTPPIDRPGEEDGGEEATG